MRISFILPFISGIIFILPLSAQHQVLYGMTNWGGNFTRGTIIRFDPSDSSESVVHYFNTNMDSDGSHPNGELVYDASHGVFYGMTSTGGVYNDGTIISFDPHTNSENLLYSFGNNFPDGDLTYDPQNGLYYGMTASSIYSIDGGAVIVFDPSTDLAGESWDFGRFRFNDGASPSGNLIYDHDNGLFYGMTGYGGDYQSGAIISFDPMTGRDSVLWSFGNGSDGADPYGSLIYNESDSSYYGMTSSGGVSDSGTIFRFNPYTNSEQVLWDFGSGTDGAHPRGNLVYDTTRRLFYGMTNSGGQYYGGTIFSFNPSAGTDSVLWNFGMGADGKNPLGDIVYAAATGRYYGMTGQGGDSAKGTIFSFDPVTNSESILWNFGHGSDGAYPEGSFTLYTEPRSACPNINITTTLIGDSTAYASAAGGTAPYSYAWSTLPAQYSDNATGLVEKHYYTVIATDTNGCTGTATIHTPCHPMTISVIQIGKDSAYAVPIGGVPPYYYFWNGVSSPYADTVSLSPAHNYTVIVTDYYGCTDSAWFSLSDGIKNISTPAISISPNPTSGIVSLSGLTAGQMIEVYDYLGQKISAVSVIDATEKINISTYCVGIYIITVLNADGSSIIRKKIVKAN